MIMVAASLDVLTYTLLSRSRSERKALAPQSIRASRLLSGAAFLEDVFCLR